MNHWLKNKGYWLLLALVVLGVASAATPCQAQQVVLRKGDTVFSRDVTLADAAKYTQLSVDAVDQSYKFWTSFEKSLPDSADHFKNALTVMVLVDTLTSGPSDPLRYQKALKTLVDFGLGYLASEYEKAGYMPLATVNTLFTLYNESLKFFRDRVFIPGLADTFYDVYKSHRLGAGTFEHEAAWNLTHIPEPVVADVALRVVLKRHGVDPGVYEDVKFDAEHFAKASRSATGKAAGRVIHIQAEPGKEYYGRAFTLQKDISSRIEIKAGFVQGYENHMVDIMAEISSRDMRQRKYKDTTGYTPLTASDERAVEQEIRALFERMKRMDMGKKLREEALEHIGHTFRMRYQQELADRVLRERAAVARAVLKREAVQFAAFSRVRLVTVKGTTPQGDSVPLEGAALYVDGKLCSMETNGNKPCGTNRYGLAGLHLPDGGHDVQARATGYAPETIRIFSQPPAKGDTSPEEYEVVLKPLPPRDYAVLVRSGDPDGSAGPPLAGARLTLRMPGTSLTAQTDDQGRAVFRQVPAGSVVRIEAQAEGHEPGDFRDVALDPEPRADAPLTLGLEPWRTDVAVTVLGLDGAPLAGAEVRMADVERVTGQDGVALFEGMPPSPPEGWTVSAVYSELPPATGNVQLRPSGPDPEPLEHILRFAVSGGILAVVRDAQSRVPAGAVVVVQGPDGETRRHAADANGYVRLQDLALGAYYLHAEARDFPAGKDREVIVTIEEPMHKVRLSPRSGVDVRVMVLGPDGSPVAGARVRLDGENEQAAPTGAARFEGVRPGKHVFTAQSDAGSGRLEREVRLSDGATQTLRLQLAAQFTSLRVRVRNEEGGTISGARVVVTRNAKPFGMQQGGSVVFDSLTEGFYTVEADADQYVAASKNVTVPAQGGTTRQITLTLRKEPPPEPQDDTDGSGQTLATVGGEIVYAEKVQIEPNVYQYHSPGIRDPEEGIVGFGFTQANKLRVVTRFCSSVGGRPAKSQIAPFVGWTNGETIDLGGKVMCRPGDSDGGTCNVYMSITCEVEDPPCEPGDPGCEPEDADTQDDAPGPLEWTYSSSGRDGPYRTYRYVKLNGEVTSALDGKVPARFCADLGKAPAPSQPQGNVQNWQGSLVDSQGRVVCQTKNAGGTKSNCRGYTAISCQDAPEPGAGAPCDPNDPLCGLDQPL